MPSRQYLALAASTDVDIVDAVNDPLSALGVQQIPDNGPDTIAQRISAMAAFIRRSGAGDPSKRMALADYGRRNPTADQPASREEITRDIAIRKGLPYEAVLARVPW